MKTALFLLLFATLSFAGNAHEYFFAFAEIDYNPASSCFEITLEGSAHDVEDVLNETGITIGELEDHYTDSVMLRQIEGFISNGLVLSSGGKTAQLHLEGMEVQPNGLVHFYLKTDPITFNGTLDLQFDWLMDALPKQQNKASVRYEHQTHTAVFLPHQRRTSIKFNQK